MALEMEASVKMCDDYIQEIVADPPAEGTANNKNASKDKLRANPKVQALLRELDVQRQPNGGFPLHPKMEMLKTLLIQHFASSAPDVDDTIPDGGDAPRAAELQTRAMVFVTNRGCVDEIEEMLATENPLIRPKRFIGQGTDKQGKKGFAQKEQLDVSLHLICEWMTSLPYIDHKEVQGGCLQCACIYFYR